MFSLRNYIDIVEGNATLSEQPVANPYTGADAEKFARLSPEDQAWYTKGGGKPDLNDPYIAARAPNKGKLGAAPAAAPAAAPGAGTAAAAMAAPSATTAAAPADDRNEMDKASDAAAAANPAKPPVAQAATPAPAAGAATGGAAAAMAASANPAKPPAAASAANPATGVNAQGQNVSINNPDGSKTNPETGEVTPAAPAQAATPAPAAPAAAAAPANRDAMPFGKAFADARAKGEKEFTWKGKKYAVTMAKPAAKPAQAATPAKPLPGVAVPGGGQISDTPAAESVQMNEFDMDMDRIMKNMGNMSGANKTSSFKSNIDGKQDDTETGFNAAMGKFNDMAKSMNLPGGAKIDPANIQGSVDSIKKGIMGQLGSMGKQDDTPSTAPGANIPNPTPTPEKQDPKDLLKNMPSADIEKLSGDDAKVLLAQLKKLAGM